MKTAIITIVVILIVIIAIIKTQKNKSKIATNENEIPIKRKRLLSEAEANFFNVMKLIMPENREITCKCRLEDIMSVTDNEKKQTWRNKIKSRHVDFIVFNPENGYTDFAIELDDESHKNRKDDDEFKNKLFDQIKMPLIRIKAKKTYDPKEIKRIIEEKIVNSRR